MSIKRNNEIHNGMLSLYETYGSTEKKKRKKENAIEKGILTRIPIFQINEMIGDDGKSQSG